VGDGVAEKIGSCHLAIDLKQKASDNASPSELSMTRSTRYGGAGNAA
jgi:hypothetical protein